MSGISAIRKETPQSFPAASTIEGRKKSVTWEKALTSPIGSDFWPQEL